MVESVSLLWINNRVASARPAWANWPAVWPVVTASAALGAALAYGQFRLAEPLPDAARPPLRAALIQGAAETIFEVNRQRDVETFSHYYEATLAARRQNADLQLVIWPESMFNGASPEFLYSAAAKPPPQAEVDRDEFLRNLQALAEAFDAKSRIVSERLNQRGDNRPSDQISLLVGVQTIDFRAGEMKLYNSALLINPAGAVAQRYAKMHPVMFGEYIPLGRQLPWLYDITPMPNGLTPGEGPVSFDATFVRISPSICFESTVPHLIRRQLVELERRGQRPDVLVNLTNDGWFWGSSILDLHLQCAIFRAVENRRPLLVAANTGLSASIDSHGRVIERGPRRASAIIRVEAHLDGRRSWWSVWGDWPARLCCAFAVLLGAWGLFRPASRWSTP